MILIRNNSISSGDFLIINEMVSNLYKNKTNVEESLILFLHSLKEIVYYDKADILLFESNEKGVKIKHCIPQGWEEPMLNKYLEYYYKIDDVLPMLATSSPIMFRSTDFFVMSERVKTEYYQGMIDPAGIHYSLEGNIIPKNHLSKRIYGEIGLFRSKDKKDFSRKDLKILKLMQGHISNFINNNYHLYTSKTFDKGTLNRILHIGICLFDNSLRLIFFNQGFELIIKKHNNKTLKDVIIREAKCLCKTLSTSPLTFGLHQTIESKIKHENCLLNIKAAYFKPNDLSHKYSFMVMVDDISHSTKNALLTIKKQYNLTDREYEITCLVLDGLTNIEIANSLFISINSVKKHLSNIYKKFDASGRYQLIAYCVNYATL